MLKNQLSIIIEMIIQADKLTIVRWNLFESAVEFYKCYIK